MSIDLPGRGHGFASSPAWALLLLLLLLLLQVFAPLARLLGLYTIKEELEELSFK